MKISELSNHLNKNINMKFKQLLNLFNFQQGNLQIN